MKLNRWIAVVVMSALLGVGCESVKPEVKTSSSSTLTNRTKSTGYTFTPEERLKIIDAELGNQLKNNKGNGFIFYVSLNSNCTLVVIWANKASTHFNVEGQACEDAKNWYLKDK